MTAGGEAFFRAAAGAGACCNLMVACGSGFSAAGPTTGCGFSGVLGAADTAEGEGGKPTESTDVVVAEGVTRGFAATGTAVGTPATTGGTGGLETAGAGGGTLPTEGGTGGFGTTGTAPEVGGAGGATGAADGETGDPGGFRGPGGTGGVPAIGAGTGLGGSLSGGSLTGAPC